MRCTPGAALLACVLGACGERADEQPWRVRLWEAAGTLSAPSAQPPRVRVGEDFAARPAGWHVLTDQHAVLAVEGEALRLEPGREEARDFLTLSGRGGALYTLLEVEPDTTYAFRGTLRARGVEPEGAEFHGATFWVGEFSRRGTPAELFAGGGWVDRTHAIASAHGEEGWRERAFVFRTLPSTKALALGCLLSVNESLKAGAVDFDRLELAEVDEREFFEYEAARAVAEQHRGEPPFAAGDWRARRSVGAMLGFEQRPAILLLPGETLELEFAAPRGPAEIAFATAPWPAAFSAGASARLRCEPDDGSWNLESAHELAPGSSLADQSWHEVRSELPSGAGRRQRLRFSVEGDLPLVLGAPELVGAAPARRRPNVVLVSIDTLRADRVGAYGATGGATPQLDAFAAQALLFQDMTANAPYTLPAHASLFSGQFPSVHGVEDKGRVLATTRSPILARTLAAHGYRTAAFTSAVFLTPEFGFAQGFDTFTTIDPFRHEDSRFFQELATTRPEQGLTDERRRAGLAPVFAWLERHRAEPFFLFLHTYEVHDYDPPRAEEPCPVEGCGIAALDYREFLLKKNRREPFPGEARERAHIGHLYDQALRHVDTGLGRLLAELARLGLEDETLVVVTSDHGEELFEQLLQHGKSLQREQLSIPLIVRVPGEAPRRVATPAMQVDLVPTLLARLGLPPDARVQGVDLLGQSAPRPLWSEVHDAFARQSSVREGGWKLVHAPRGAEVVFPAAFEWRLFDVARDPGELEDLVEREPARFAALQELHGRFAAELEARASELGPLGDAEALDEAMQKLLDDMGYGGH